MKRFLLLFCYSFVWAISVHAQENCYSIANGKARVTAIGGLSLRAAPRQASLRIGIVPMGAIVEVSKEEEAFCMPGLLPSLEMILENEGEGSGSTYSRNGCWVKVHYKAQTGYVLDTYLANLEQEEFVVENEGDLGLSANYYLGFPGSNCLANLPSNGYLNWYGVFQNENTESASLEKVELSLFCHREENFQMVTFAQPSAGLKMIIGSKKALKANSPIEYYPIGAGDFHIFENGKYYQNEVLAKKYGLRLELPNSENVDVWQARPLTLSRNGKTQLLNPEELGLTGPISLYWASDFDSDNETDFVIQFGEKPGRLVLFLSSEAKRNEIVRAVAAFTVTYCC